MMRTHPYMTVVEHFAPPQRRSPMCPHMPLSPVGEYSLATIASVITYRNEFYEIMTCCTDCAQHISMNPGLYLVFEGEKVYAKHKDTGHKVQEVKRVRGPSCEAVCGDQMHAIRNKTIKDSCLCVPNGFIPARDILKQAKDMRDFSPPKSPGPSCKETCDKHQMNAIRNETIEGSCLCVPRQGFVSSGDILKHAKDMRSFDVPTRGE